jgi:RimJ/RimL family protein N-acetyltransferase
LSAALPADSAAVLADTARLYLRELAKDDATLYCDLYCDPETMRFIGPPLSPQRAMKSFGKALRLTQRRPAQWLFMAIVEKTTRQVVGISSIQLHAPNAEIGVMLCAVSRTHGYGKEITPALIALAFELLPVDAVWLCASAEHRVAERVAMGIGFSRGADVMDRDTNGLERAWSIDRHAWDHAQRNLPVSKLTYQLHRST